jgi:predicted glycogen debranching enzyme
MTELIRRIPWPARDDAGPGGQATREWLVTNGLGGYASGTVSTRMTRRYHGLLIAALPAPLGRMNMLSHLHERLDLGDAGIAVTTAGWEADAGGKPAELLDLAEFRLETGLPVWRYELGPVVLEKRLLLPYRQNTVHVCYRLVAAAGPVNLHVRPAVHFRPHERPVSDPLVSPYGLTVLGDRYELFATPELPRLRFKTHGPPAAFRVSGHTIQQVLYPVERSRGYEATGDLWSPGYFRVTLEPGGTTTLVASTEPWEAIDALDPDTAWQAEQVRRQRLLSAAHPLARHGPAAELVLAADQFVIAPAGRVADTARTRATGDEARTIIAGYHWFTDWGRDTMIDLEGLTLLTGRHVEAGYILRTFALYVRDGLIPNMFPEGTREGLYHTADASLWYFHALDRYLRATGDRDTLRLLLPTLVSMVDHHVRGTRFGIGVDPADGLLRQGAPGYQLTWMDAKVDDWVVTPRRGKAVEINALWYNALRLLEGWLRDENDEAAAAQAAARAAEARAAFNRRFWYAEGGYLYDVVDGERGDDPACRPNQLFAISLDHPVLDEARWPAVLQVVRTRLLTPMGLRTLAPGHPDYKATYDGDLRARDAAYHQGTVWPWLIGPFVDAWLRVHPEERRVARRLLDDFWPHLDQACVGSISEICDAEEPFTPRGCIAQGWSVAEVLRALVLTADPEVPVPSRRPGRARATDNLA